MRVKLHENVPARLSQALTHHGHNAVTVPQQGLQGQSDLAVWEAAQREKRLLITMDLDFADIRTFPPGAHAALLILRPVSQGRKAIRHLLQAVLARHSLDTFSGCLVVADESAIPIRKP